MKYPKRVIKYHREHIDCQIIEPLTNSSNESEHTSESPQTTNKQPNKGL